ncbi:MAG TPA: response regulator [Steroidobacteraceae bacterium]
MCDTRVVCVVDDDDGVRRSVRNLLSALRFRVEAFDSAESFLHSMHRENIGCLVLDLRMPGMSGEELLIHLANAGAPIPTVILTAHGDSRVRERLRALGVLAVLSKPFKSELLLKAISAAMGLKP